MGSKKVRTTKVIAIAAGAFLLAVVGLLETAFFHVNPLKIGYHRFDYGSYVVFTRRAAVDSDYGAIPAILYRNEALHGLRYNAKVQIIICEKQSDLDRFQPFLSAASRRNVVAVAPWPNTVYVTPGLKEKYHTAGPALAHELSHLLLMQNYGVLRAWRLRTSHEWILEGFATYFADFPDYFPRDQLLAKAESVGVNFDAGRLPGLKDAGNVPLPIRFMIYKYFVGYLFQRNPSATVIQFLKDACSNPGAVERVFESSFGESLSEYVRAFGMEIGRNST